MPLISFAVVDFETTGLLAAEGAEAIELGLTHLTFDTEKKKTAWSPPAATLFRPERPCPPEARAVHHISPADYADKSLMTPADLRAAIETVGATFVASHNWAMEAQWFTPDILGDVRPICTMKCARRIWPEIGGFGNQFLRYALDLEAVNPSLAEPPHRAGPDTHVTAVLLAKMLETERVRDLVAWTLAPIYYATCPLGKWKGRAWCDVEHSYLTWMISQRDMDPDIRAAAQAEIDFRKTART